MKDALGHGSDARGQAGTPSSGRNRFGIAAGAQFSRQPQPTESGLSGAGVAQMWRAAHQTGVEQATTMQTMHTAYQTRELGDDLRENLGLRSDSPAVETTRRIIKRFRGG